MARCEDYPCCGHTDGLPCDWVYVPGPHDGCDHEAGYCDVADYDDDESDESYDETAEPHDSYGWIGEL